MHTFSGANPVLLTELKKQCSLALKWILLKLNIGYRIAESSLISEDLTEAELKHVSVDLMSFIEGHMIISVFYSI